MLERGPPPWAGKGGAGVFLFNLTADPTESLPLNERAPELLAAHAARLRRWEEGVLASQREETLCARPAQGAAEALPLI